MAEMTKHFVTFFSPGTLFDEQSVREVDSWNVETAVAMARKIKERHSAKPFAFQFSTSVRGGDDWEPKETARSATYYLGGRVETREEIEARNDPKEEILRSNMRMNDIEKVIVNDNSWRVTKPFDPTAIILDYSP